MASISADTELEKTVARAIVGAVVGYLIMAVAVMAGITGVWYLIGPSAVFVGEGPEVTTTWSVACLLLGLPAAALGGWVAARIGLESGRSGSVRKGTARNALRFLVGLILLLGVSSSVWQLKDRAGQENLDASPLPIESLTFLEAGAQAQQPAWYLWVLPWTGALGALFGGSVVTKELPDVES